MTPTTQMTTHTTHAHTAGPDPVHARNGGNGDA